jgi:formate/nitrite transporter FocA (FNT family)
MNENEEAEERQRLRSPLVYEIVRREAEVELERPLRSLWWSGVAAGIALSSSLLAEGLLHHYLPSLAGNIIGGTGLFAMLAYGQVRAEL